MTKTQDEILTLIGKIVDRDFQIAELLNHLCGQHNLNCQNDEVLLEKLKEFSSIMGIT